MATIYDVKVLFIPYAEFKENLFSWEDEDEILETIENDRIFTRDELDKYARYIDDETYETIQNEKNCYYRIIIE